MSETPLKFEIVVIGGGPAGLAAACAAAECGKRVALVDDTPWLGGQIWRGQQTKPSVPQAQKWLERFRRSGATLVERTSIIAAPRPGVLIGEQPNSSREIHWQQLILATGARELFLPFPGWTLPGVYGPGGLQALVKNGWPICNQRVVIAGSGPLLLAVADGLRPYGAKIIAIAEQAPWARVMGFGFKLLTHPAKLAQALQLKGRLLGIPYHCGTWPVKAEGDTQLRRVTLTDGQRTWTEECEALACGFGLVPNVELPLVLGCQLQDDFVRVNQWQASSVPEIYCAGEITGIGGADAALVEGQIAGYAVAGQRALAEGLFAQRDGWHEFRDALAHTFALRTELKSLATDDTLLCRCEDVTLGRVRKFSGWRDAKLQTRCGMGACQGRVCGAAAKVILGWGMESVRPPVLPARVGSLMTTKQHVDTPS